MTTLTHFRPPVPLLDLNKQLATLSKSFTEHQGKARALVVKAFQTPEAQRHAVVQQCRAVNLAAVGINWECQRLMAQIAQEIPQWEICDALHNPELERYGFIRLEGITDDQHLILESFDMLGNGTIERLAMLDFNPEKWEVIGRNIYEDRLNEVLEYLTWK